MKKAILTFGFLSLVLTSFTTLEHTSDAPAKIKKVDTGGGQVINGNKKLDYHTQNNLASRDTGGGQVINGNKKLDFNASADTGGGQVINGNKKLD